MPKRLTLFYDNTSFECCALIFVLILFRAVLMHVLCENELRSTPDTVEEPDRTEVGRRTYFVLGLLLTLVDGGGKPARRKPILYH